MKYSIFYLFGGEAGRYRDKLVQDVAQKFGERDILDSRMPAHLTLKVPFETNMDILEVENSLREVTNKYESQDFEINGFDNFHNRVIFLNFTKPSLIIEIKKELIQKLENIKGISIHQHDREFNLHATVAHCRNEKYFSDIWNYVNKIEKPYFKMRFDNLTLMKKPGKYWEVCSVFKLK